MKTRVAWVPEDKKVGMTLDEMSAFVAQAYSMGIPGDTRLEVNQGIRLQVKMIAAETKEGLG